jgi:hypothetical protein
MGAAQDRDDIRAACAPKSAYDLLTMIMGQLASFGCHGGEVPAAKIRGGVTPKVSAMVRSAAPTAPSPAKHPTNAYARKPKTPSHRPSSVAHIA